MQESSLLLALPDPCLLTVLQCCAAEDRCSLFSAARAHSRLHHAATVALTNITAVLPQQQKARSVKHYLGKHAKHISSINLKGTEGYTVSLRELPPVLQLKGLQLEWFHLQLHPATAQPRYNLGMQLRPAKYFQGVLGNAGQLAALKQLRLTDCDILLDCEGRAEVLFGPGGLAALSVLTGLEHLSISRIFYKDHDKAEFPTGILPRLQRLTCLELSEVHLTLGGVDIEDRREKRGEAGADEGQEQKEREEEGQEEEVWAHILQPLQVSKSEAMHMENNWRTSRLRAVCMLDMLSVLCAGLALLGQVTTPTVPSSPRGMEES
jgi:hypothetical protein